jgi:hypothetical protein
MWSRACDLLTNAGYDVRYRPGNGGRYDVKGLAENVLLKRVNELAVEKGLLRRP